MFQIYLLSSSAMSLAEPPTLDPFDFPVPSLPDEIGRYRRGLLLGQTYAGFVYGAFDTAARALVMLVDVYAPYVDLPWDVRAAR